MKIEAAVFPFHEQMLPFVRHFNQAQDTYHICQAITWNGTGLSGQDAAFVCLHPNIGISVVSPTAPEAFMDWQALLVDCDALEQADSAFDPFAFFDQLLSEGKKIIVATRKSDLCTTDGWKALCQKYAEQIQIFYPQNEAKKNPLVEDGGYKSLSLPVLMVGGLITQEDCMEIVLALRESLLRRGEIASCLIRSNMGLLMGMHSYANIFDKESALSEEKKAMALNRLAQDIVQAERPSLLIVEAPDPMLKYNNAAPNGFGLQTYLICQALKPDALVCSIPADMAEESFLSLISKDFEVRYGMPVTAIHISNVVIDSFSAVQFHRITRVHTDMDRVVLTLKQQSKNLTFPAFDVVSEGADGIVQLIFQ